MDSNDRGSKVEWVAIGQGIRVKGAGEDNALLYQVVRFVGDEAGEWVVEGRVAGRSHHGTFRDEYLAHDVLGLLADMMQREMPEEDDGFER